MWSTTRCMRSTHRALEDMLGSYPAQRRLLDRPCSRASSISMTPRSEPAPPRGSVAATVEGVLWVGFACVAVSVAIGTVASEFPGRGRALMGEAVVVLVALALAGLALRRVARGSGTGPWTWAAAGLRVVVLLPVLAVLLVAAAAAFTA